MKDFYMILGNGFTIDMLNHLNIGNEKIDVRNLFAHGDRVPYPQDNEPGFLSYKRCSNLWGLGARPYMNNDDAIGIIEDIITCSNIASSARERHLSSTYIQAYQELSTYLKYLFVYYDKKIKDEELRNGLVDWGWLKLLKNLAVSEECKSITIVTFNYDIWLERILINHNINFEICGIENGIYNSEEPSKIKIIKPHGSISFAYKDPIDKGAFQISSPTRDLTNGELSDYKVIYNNLDNIYSFNALIPPAGDSAKLGAANWASELRNRCIESAKELNYSGELILSGISYWHVDRAEIDDIFTSIHPGVNVKVVNPHPSNTLSAVLSSLFEKNVIYRSSEILGDLYNGH